MTDTLQTWNVKARARHVMARRRGKVSAAAPINDAAAPQEPVLVLVHSKDAQDDLTNIEMDAFDPPFDPPDAEDILGAVDADESDAPRDDVVCAAIEQDEVLVAVLVADEPAPVVEHAFDAAADADEDEPPFDPPDADDIEHCVALEAPPVAREPELAPAPAPSEMLMVAAPAPEAPRVDRRRPDKPLPPIKVHASWDRPAMAEVLIGMAGDQRLARADMSIERGGLDGAALRFASQSSPDLLIVDTTLTSAHMLSGLDRLAQVMEQGAKVIVVGGVNDIGLFRELAARGINEYIVAPVRKDDLIRAVCRLYAETDRSRVIAVIGARGGVGASTIAHNLAWSIAERQRTDAALVDLDLPFGTAAFSVGLDSAGSVADVLFEDAQIDDLAATQTEQLRVLAAPVKLEQAGAIDAQGVDALIARARRASPVVVLDLPHEWNGWVKHALRGADDVVIVSGPDLASLASAKGMLEVMKGERGKDACAPLVALSMVGVPKRPEISFKDFANALGAAPAAVFAFEPDVFGMAALKGKMIGEIAPRSKAALAFDELATLLTGRAPATEKRAYQPAMLSTPQAPAPFAKQPQKERRAPAPAPMQCEQQMDLFPQAKAAEPLTLDVVAPNDYLAKARSAAEAEMEAQQSAARAPRGLGLRRLVGAVAALGLLTSGSYWLQTESGVAVVPEAYAASTSEASGAKAHYEQAMQVLNAGDLQRGVAMLRAAAEDGSAQAQYRLAKFYERGHGVEASVVMARAWTERAAALGNARAMHDLGVFLARGEGGVRDEAAAFRWFRQAAELNVADSQFNLGVLYAQGRGVSADANEALFWFALAARQGDEAAAARASALEANLSLMQIEQARARAAAFRSRSPSDTAN